jgi:hypothetical protein
MEYPFSLPGYPQLNLCLKTSGVLGGVRILLDGAELKPTKGSYIIPLTDGTQVEFRLKTGMDLSMPRVLFNGEVIEAAPPLPLLWILWSFTPLLLVFVGGAIGGGVGWATSMAVFATLRSRLPEAGRIVLALFLPFAGLAIYSLLVAVIIGSRR